MKKNLMLLAALALTTVGTAFAQVPAPAATGTAARQTARHYAKAPKSPEQKADRNAGKMAKELGLNPDQEAQVEKLLLARQQESAALKATFGADKKAGRPGMKAANDRYHAGLKSILTADQYARFDQMKDEHRGRGHGKDKDAK